MHLAAKTIGSPVPLKDGFLGRRSLLAPAAASALAVILTSLAVKGRERVSKTRPCVRYLPGIQIGKIHLLDLEEVKDLTNEQLSIEADMFIRAGQRARKEIEDSGWVSDEDLERHTNAILLGRQAEATCKDAVPPRSRSAWMETVTHAYESLLANAQLCRQVLDKEPSQDQTLLDIHVAACINLNKLRDAYRGLASTISTCKPDERFRSEELLAGARHCLKDLFEVFQTWEEEQGPALKEVHRKHAEEILRRSQQSVGSLIPQGEGGLSRLHCQPHEILRKDEELELGRKIEEANKAYTQLSEFGWKCKKGRSELANAVRDGQSAKRRLALMNLRLVASIARKVERRFPSFKWSSLTFEDLLQEGDVGLIAAIERYDWRRGYRFSTFATWSIRQAIRKAILDKGSTIRIPIARKEQIRKMAAAERTFWMDHERKPTNEELSALLGVQKRIVESIKEAAEKGRKVQELDAPRSLGFSEGNADLARLSDSAASPLETLADQEEHERLSTILSLTMQKLSKEELIAIGMRYGLNGRDQANYTEIAEVLGKPSTRAAWQLVSRGVTKLRGAVKEQRWTGMGDLGSKPDQAMLHSMYSSLMLNSPLSPQ
jgi:RNA polymerase primary sigma factor